MKKIILLILTAIVFLPSTSAGEIRERPVNPRLRLFERWRLPIQNLGLDAENARVQEMGGDFSFDSVKTQPKIFGIWLETVVIPEDKPSGKEWFEVVLVLDSDCKLPGIQQNICQRVKGAEVFYGAPGSRPMLVIRDTPQTDLQRALSLVRAMVFLEETCDFEIPDNLTDEQARVLEWAAKEAAANELISNLNKSLAKKKRSK